MDLVGAIHILLAVGIPTAYLTIITIRHDPRKD